ncbi:hypothetical protein CPU12_01305 [Malaciobacter molluscorum LMG 25693]|uniref:Uncharacterized protein n=1 Tax=Malaciobacter molluscorum LMG 25693 TaxID=870501 RepID=A0A2G1DLR2_9BACT|nr:hypothetical protein [Malaciobacter molluscorum]AXX92217.1 hypothetical protein AMOL_1236 [Malaciobacter molluscorum LMG 25693]PHO19445.1 hypothetical protein CPU12_01305 [Malaciobacter molluscorum LMG 25693]
MKTFLEPIFLNEKMLLNIAAYLFKGVSLSEEINNENTKVNKANVSLGLKFLQDLISPLSFNTEHENINKQYSKTARIYTLGGLHMSVIDQLEKEEYLKYDLFESNNFPEANSFVKLNVILKPVDYYQIIDVLKLIKPLIIQLIDDFGTKINANLFNKNTKKEIPKYDKLVESIINSLENDYLNSKQFEMLMIDPSNKNIIGVVDIDLTDINPQEIKAKLNDGQFFVIGKISRIVRENEKVSMFQRTLLSKIVELIENLVSLNNDSIQMNNYKKFLQDIQPIIEKFIQLNLKGPAIRVMAMSINI